MDSCFTKRIVKSLKSLNIEPEEEDMQLLLSGKGLFLYGAPGTGKTIYACATALEYQRREFVLHGSIVLRNKVCFISMPDLLEKIRASFNVVKTWRPDDEKVGEKQMTTGDLLDYYNSTKLLVLDDLGAERPTDWTLHIAQLIINNRYENILPTIITSNLTLDDLSEQLDDRLASRIYEMCEIRNFGEEDYRLNR